MKRYEAAIWVFVLILWLTGFYRSYKYGYEKGMEKAVRTITESLELAGEAQRLSDSLRFEYKYRRYRDTVLYKSDTIIIHQPDTLRINNYKFKSL